MQLQLDGVAAGYGRRPVITGLSLALEAGAFVTMLGPNGAGKTTTARVIAGLLPRGRAGSRSRAATSRGWHRTRA